MLWKRFGYYEVMIVFFLHYSWQIDRTCQWLCEVLWSAK